MSDWQNALIRSIYNTSSHLVRSFETTQLLLKSGADPFAKSRYGDDDLQTACLKGSSRIFDLLLETIDYPAERLANAHELIGSTFLDEKNETRTAMQHWRIAHQMRQKVEPYMRESYFR